MARVFILFALCLLPALATAARMMNPVIQLKEPLTVHGGVYCDNCRFGYWNPKATSIPGATVKIQCLSRDTLKEVYSVEVITNEKGEYEVTIPEDHLDQICNAVLVKSSQKDCATPIKGSDASRVILTNNNGLRSCHRYTNKLGFMKDTAIQGCTALQRLYSEDV